MFKIRKIEFKEHPILRNLSLDFCDSSGEAVDTIIFAGENGTGKSTILNALYQIASHKVDFECSLEVENNGVVFNLNYYFEPYGTKEYLVYAKDNRSNKMHFSSVYEKYPFTAIYSDVDINFHTQKINAVTSLSLDSTDVSRRSDNNLPKQINQLIIDIQALDDAEIALQARKNPEKGLKEFRIEERMPRFTKAFAKIFDALSYSRVINQNNQKTILFQKNGVDIPIDGLSSGEKQIVYRGCFLLKDINAISGAFVFIDEPEISLHPKWQSKIMDYYKGIFTGSDGLQTSQIFTVTHSPFVIHNENRRNDKVLVLSRNNEGEIVVDDKPEYYKCTSVEVIQDAFSINDFSVEKSMVYLEGRTDEMYFKKALEVYGYNVSFEFKWVGHIDAKGQEVNTGKDALKKAAHFLMSQNRVQKNVCLFDCDTSKQDQENNNVFIRAIPNFDNSKGMRAGIENALVLDKINIQPYYEEKIKEGNYGEKSTIVEFRKMQFCEYICSLNAKELVDVFYNLKQVIDSLIELFEDN